MAVPTLVQHVDANFSPFTPASSQASIRTVRFANPVLSGNCVIVAICWGGSVTISNVKDDKSNSYSAVTSYYDTTNGQNIAIYVLPNITNGPRKITVTFSGTTVFIAVKASEFYNVATSSPVDVYNATTGSTSSTIGVGSITPGTANDLLYMVGWADSVAVPTGAIFTAGSQSNITWSLVPCSCNTYDGSFAQYGQYSSSGSAFSPQLTESGATSYFICAVVALKSAAAGTAPAAGIRVIGSQHLYAGESTTSVVTQFVTQGNLQVCLGTSGLISSIASTGANTNSFTSRQNAQDTNGQVWYASIWDSVNASAGTNKLTISMAGVPGQDFVLLDVTGAATSPYDTGAVLTNQDTTSGSTITLPSITPSTSNGLVVAVASIADGTATDPTNSSQYSISATEDSGYVQYSESDENNAYGIYYNPNTSAVQFVWTIATYSAGYWSGATATYKASGGGATVYPDSWQRDTNQPVFERPQMVGY